MIQRFPLVSIFAICLAINHSVRRAVQVKTAGRFAAGVGNRENNFEIIPRKAISLWGCAGRRLQRRTQRARTLTFVSCLLAPRDIFLVAGNIPECPDLAKRSVEINQNHIPPGSFQRLDPEGWDW